MPSVCDIDTGTVFESRSCYRDKTASRDNLAIYVLGDDNVDSSQVNHVATSKKKWSNKVIHAKGTNYVLVGRSAHCLVSVCGSAKLMCLTSYFALIVTARLVRLITEFLIDTGLTGYFLRLLISCQCR